jgi:hypothetical protein
VATDPQVAAIAARLRAEAAEAAKTLVLEIDANLRAATPVDTGHARANWVPSVGEAFAAEAAGSAAHDAGVAQVLSFKLGDGDLYETNNVPYIGRLIGGSSSQAPAGWDLAAVDQAQQTVQARYDGLQIDVTTGPDATVTIAPRAPGGDEP